MSVEADRWYALNVGLATTRREMEFAVHTMRGALRTAISKHDYRNTQRDEWNRRKDEGRQVAALLEPLPVGHEFRLTNVASAYAATYRKNDEGTWDQVTAPVNPLVTHMDAEHLGFCVGLTAIEKEVL